MVNAMFILNARSQKLIGNDAGDKPVLQALRNMAQRFSTGVTRKSENLSRISFGSREDGFTLIEIVVALAILALSLGVLFGVISDGIRRADDAGRMSRASALAQSLLARIGAENPVQRGEASGTEVDGFRWHARIVPYGTGEDQQSWSVGAYAVRVDVSWGDLGHERSVALSTLRLGIKEAGR